MTGGRPDDAPPPAAPAPVLDYAPPPQPAGRPRPTRTRDTITTEFAKGTLAGFVLTPFVWAVASLLSGTLAGGTCCLVGWPLFLAGVSNMALSPALAVRTWYAGEPLRP